MLKELKEKCEKQLEENDSCYGCPHQEQCEAFNDLLNMGRGFVQVDSEPWELTDHFAERFDELIAKMGGEPDGV